VPLGPADLQSLKENFLRRNNPENSEVRALASGVKAAARRNALYRPWRGREPVRRYWKELLLHHGESYARDADMDRYEQDVLGLKEEMMVHFSDRFLKTGFRVSHAQKSLAVVLQAPLVYGPSQ
jgi:hypothetical protein